MQPVRRQPHRPQPHHFEEIPTCRQVDHHCTALFIQVSQSEAVARSHLVLTRCLAPGYGRDRRGQGPKAARGGPRPSGRWGRPIPSGNDNFPAQFRDRSIVACDLACDGENDRRGSRRAGKRTPMSKDDCIKKPSAAAGGWGALKSVGRQLMGTGKPLTGAKTLLSLNQADGFDCPGCAWGDPEHGSSFEFCENGVKAVAWEATRRGSRRSFSPATASPRCAHGATMIWNIRGG